MSKTYECKGTQKLFYLKNFFEINYVRKISEKEVKLFWAYKFIKKTTTRAIKIIAPFVRVQKTTWASYLNEV